MAVNNVSIVETTPINKSKYCIIGVPDVGLVGVIASSYIVSSLNMTEIGYFESEMFPPIIVVHEGNPKSFFRIYQKDDIVVITSEIPLQSQVIPSTARAIVDWAKTKNIELLISLTGIAVQNRLEINVPSVYGVGNNKAVMDLLNKANVESFEEGFMVGLHALIMKESSKNALQNMILLAQSHYQYPDPAAAASIIDSINKFLSIKVDTSQLLAEAEEIRLKTRELMQRTQRSMQKTQKDQEQEIPGMYA